MWKLTRKIVLIALCFLLIVIALLIGVNGFKSSPSETHVSLAQVPPNLYADQDNLFLARAGIDIPEMDNRLTEAKNRILQKTQWAEDKAYSKLSPEQLAAGEPQFAVISFVKSVEWCNPVKRPCLGEIDQQHAAIQASKAANSVLLQRYLALPQFKGAYDTTPPNLYAPYSFSKVSDVRLLFLAHVGNGFLHGTESERADALQQLAYDLGVWKTSLAGHSSLIDKMIAVHFLHQSLALTAEIVNHPRFDTERDGYLLKTALQDDAVRDFSAVWNYEFRFMQHALNSALDQGQYQGLFFPNNEEDSAPSTTRNLLGKTISWFFDPVDTQNDKAEFFAQVIAASKLPPAQSMTALKALEAQTKGSHSAWWTRLHNPVGKTLNAFANPDLTAYPERIYDVFAYQKLVHLALQWRTQQLAPNARAAQLKANPTQAQHPASQVPFTYDSATHTLRMEALQPRGDRRYEVVLFTPSQ
jgi:hypothetical protein